MKIFIDQMGRKVPIPRIPERIISLVPSQTELLFDMGLETKIIGITKFCVHPAGKVSDVAKIGGTKNLNIQKIRELRPDLIIGNKEENERSQIELLEKEFPVWMSDILNLNDACIMIRECGNITGKNEIANSISDRVVMKFQTIQPFKVAFNVVYLIWKEPYMVAGRNTFIDEMLMTLGLRNSIIASRYPEISLEEVIAIKPELIFLSSEPYPFKEKHCDEFKNLVPGSLVRVVDGEMFSWYGSRLIYSADYFKSLQDEIRDFLNKK